jgi:phage terminase small subunit
MYPFCTKPSKEGAGSIVLDQSSKEAKEHPTAWLDAFELTPKQRVFVLAYLEDLNATDAARRAGYAHPNKQGPRMLVNVGISNAIEAGQRKFECNLMISAEQIRWYWWTLGTAQLTDLVEILHICCRHCHGIDHEYQWICKAEFEKVRAETILELYEREEAIKVIRSGDSLNPLVPTDAGGYGFRKMKAPHPDCPWCSGIGETFVHTKDTKNLSEAGKLLFNGVRMTSNGPVISIQNRQKALYNLAKSLGMFSKYL